MPEEDCPTCNDHALPGEPVRGHPDVYAYVLPMPPDDQLTVRPAEWQSSARAGASTQGQAAAQGARVELLEGIPEPPPELGPTRGTTSPQARAPVASVFPDNTIHDGVLDTGGEQVQYLARLGVPWFEDDVESILVTERFPIRPANLLSPPEGEPTSFEELPMKKQCGWAQVF